MQKVILLKSNISLKYTDGHKSFIYNVGSDTKVESESSKCQGHSSFRLELKHLGCLCVSNDRSETMEEKHKVLFLHDFIKPHHFKNIELDH